ncbi:MULTISPECIES: hypothetical protein [unclassified Methylobacterium]|uniref:hypothetical protein n=1 Tax=unclassified Methylobacterium TaxID=2615210 RepID=UPI001FB91403|nr:MULTISPECIES: hypothetical protein [unclassified Methylobacterium]MCJ2018331.1 hypothetical protein [Methylobacterium sp. E-065]
MTVMNLVLLVLALLATTVMAVGWLQDPAAPTPTEWFVAKVSEGGSWAGLFLTLLAVAYFTWRASHAAGKAKGPN